VRESAGVAILLGLLAALAYGTADFLGGLGARRNPIGVVALLSHLAGLVLCVSAVGWVVPGPFTAGAWVWGSLSGLAGAFGSAYLYQGLRQGRMSLVAPLSGLVAALVPVAVGLATGERPTNLQLMGMVVSLPAIVLLSRRAPTSDPSAAEGGRAPTAKNNVAWRQGLLAGLGLGGFLALLGNAGPQTSLWPLVASRLVSTSIFAAALTITRTSLLPSPGSTPLLIATGVLGVVGGLSFLLGVGRGPLSIVSVAAALYPGVTVLLARVTLREQLSTTQVAGLGVALFGVAAMSSG
jgi:drug/metabolite transporter (DMT)-like permease